MSAIRFRIQSSGNATLAGIYRLDLQSIFNAATLHYQGEFRRLRSKKRLTQDDREMVYHVKNQLKLLDSIKEAVRDAIDATYPPPPPPTKASRKELLLQEKP